MSWNVVGPVSRLHLEGTAKIVLIMLANESDDQGRSAAAIETLGVKAGVSERTVKRLLEWYMSHGILRETEAIRGRGRARRLEIDLARAKALFGENPGWAERRAIKEKGDTMSPFHRPGKGDTLSKKGDMVSKKGDMVSPFPIKDPIKDPAPDGAADPEGTAPTGAEAAASAAPDRDRTPAAADPAPDAPPGWDGRFSGVLSFLIAIGNPPDEAAKAQRAYELRLMRRKELGPVEARLVLWHLLRGIHAEGKTETPIRERLLTAIEAETGPSLHIAARAAAETHKYGGLGG